MGQALDLGRRQALAPSWLRQSLYNTQRKRILNDDVGLETQT